MPIPKTSPLVGPPAGVDPFGRAIPWQEFISTLRTLDARFFAPAPKFAMDGHALSGITTLWLGEPGVYASGNMKGRKVCAFQAGIIPEWTIIDPRTGGFTRGWRSILDRVLLTRAVTVEQLEAAFKTTIRLDPTVMSEWCWRCANEGIDQRTTGGKSNLCLMHEQAELNAHNDPAHAGEVRRVLNADS